MNCPHSAEGWCLGCVKKLHSEKEKWVARTKFLKPSDCNIYDEFQDFCDENYGTIRDGRTVKKRAVKKKRKKS